MGIFEDFYDDIASVVKRGADSCRNTVNTAEQERIIRRMSAEIGNLVLIELDEGKEYGPAIMERYKTIVEARRIIEEAGKDAEPTKKTCPQCGKANPLEMKYCGACGADMDIIPEPKDDETEADEEPAAVVEDQEQ